MIDWEDIIRAEDCEELKEAKQWLFQENVRLENEKRELINLQDKIRNERVTFRDEMNQLNHKMVIERKRLKEENLFFEKKMAILQDGFRSLDEDRRKLDRERKQLERERMYMDEMYSIETSNSANQNVAEVLFRNVNNTLTLKKRYRDLVRIFHPDNLCGDEELVQLINKEFQDRKEST